MIKFCKNGCLYTLDDMNPNSSPELVDFKKVDPNKFFMGCLGQNVILEEGIKVEEVMFFFSLCRDFIYEYFCEYYDKFNSMIVSQQVGKKYEYLKIFKRLSVEKKYIFIEPCIDFVKYEKSNLHKNDRPDFLSQIPVVMDNQLVIQQDDLSSDIDKLMKGMEVTNEQKEENKISGNYKMEFTVLDVMESFFCDLIYSIEESRL